jgi:hypothetical protein
VKFDSHFLQPFQHLGPFLSARNTQQDAGTRASVRPPISLCICYTMCGANYNTLRPLHTYVFTFLTLPCLCVWFPCLVLSCMSFRPPMCTCYLPHIAASCSVPLTCTDLNFESIFIHSIQKTCVLSLRVLFPIPCAHPPLHELCMQS